MLILNWVELRFWQPSCEGGFDPVTPGFEVLENGGIWTYVVGSSQITRLPCSLKQSARGASKRSL